MAGCVPNITGNNNPNANQCPEPSNWKDCRPWDLTTSRDQCYIDSLTQEAVNIAGAQVNIWKLLGVTEQTTLNNLTGSGSAISSGDAPNHPAQYAFDITTHEWRSRQVGQQVISAAYIGYDFGVIKISNGRNRYGIDANVRQHITSLRIKQSSDPDYRVTKVRVERSDNGTEWFGVAVVNLPNDDKLNLIHFKHSVPNRYWRLRPLAFSGKQCDSWGVQALELFDYQATNYDNVQDKILLENRNRDYAGLPITIKGYYDLINVSTELSRFGIEIPSASYQIKINFNACVATIGRPVIIGDIIDLPSETQYTPDLRPIKRYLEVTDVTWDASSYTPGWQPTMLLITTAPALASEETQDIFGDLGATVDASGLFDGNDGNNPVWQDYSAVAQTIQADARTAVPERGSEGSNVVREFSEEEKQIAKQEGFNINKLGFNPVGLYVEDAIPSNGAPYTEGPVYPTSPANGDYHRLTYEGLAADTPAALYRWSSVKGRWIYLESDKRWQYNYQKELINEYLTSPNKIPAQDIK